MEKLTLNIVFAGHVDHGKSTLIGRLLYDTGCVPEEKMREIEKSSKEVGKEREFAFVMDHLEEERTRGITIDTAQTFFKTKNRKFVIIDVPGHREFLKNMITGSTLAQTALVLVDAEEGIREQTKRHCYLLSTLGLNKIFVLINKMDLVDYSEERYKEVENDISNYFNQLNIETLGIIPVSAKMGDNIASVSDKMEWYKGESLLEAMDKFTVYKEETTRFCLPVQDIYEFVSDESVFVGRVESGILKKGAEVTVLPQNEKVTIKDILKLGEEKLDSAGEGECVGITLDNDKKLKRGNIIAGDTDYTVTDSVKANIFWLSKEQGSIQDTYVLKCATQEYDCKISEIYKRFDPASMEIVKEGGEIISETEIAEVLLTVDHNLVVKEFSQFPQLGRFVIEKNNNIVAGGVIT